MTGTMPDKPNALVVGGTSGLGLELALLLARTHHVVVTGRQNSRKMQLEFWYLNLSSRSPMGSVISHALNELVEKLPSVDLYIHAAGFDEDGTIDELKDDDILNTLSVGLIAPAMLLERLLRKQGRLGGFIAVTSTSQVTPRLREPIYCASKAGLAMLAQCISLDPRVGKVVVAGPTGMNTPFWKKRGGRADADQLLDPRDVAKETMRLYRDAKDKFEAWFILRDPLRSVRIMESPKK